MSDRWLILLVRLTLMLLAASAVVALGNELLRFAHGVKIEVTVVEGKS